MLVTCFYDIYRNSHKRAQYLEWFKVLGFSGLPITVFTDPDFVEYFSYYPENIKIIARPLESFEIYKMGISSQCELPAIRTVEKDTREYLSLQNTKVEFLLEAMKCSDDDKFIWIDFGITKLLKNRVNFLDKLKKINEKVIREKILIPGCWENSTDISCSKISWRFCGTLLISPRNLIPLFYEECYNIVKQVCAQEYENMSITWEVNLWAFIENKLISQDRSYIEWYSGNHDDTLLSEVEYYINQ